ncbi:hypothetical protein [Halarcobacter ebronensis]|uniref:Uncharacterized protein n=1 Tax=Halarcobacter ebronensis TaxID=1462615 RepID=A0A4Q1AFX2_9BACT|nr:hypothetical protein [Halarcobacter ebronensis]QKF81480.1 putative membrane protein [Halarcobacter ebronensis]RXK02460.1 hypothetical protein CRV07_13400 [Halarcobacter ebronensis]
MGNEFNVLEKGIIKCACGGEVVLTSTVPNLKINGEKPLYLKDILNAPISGCPSKDPCTKVASISDAGTEVNVSATGLTYLLRTDGFKSDKGRAIILNDPGQRTSKISAIPSLENQDVEPEEEITKEEYQEEIIKKDTIYTLSFLRKYQDIYKPIRPTRAFRNTIETHSTDALDEFNDTSIHSHTFAFIYITQNGKTAEYQVFSKGNIYAESQKDIFFQNTATTKITEIIPIYEESKIDISYSNIQLKDNSDIKKLKKISFSPTSVDGINTFYIKELDDIDLREVTKQDIKNKKIEKGTDENVNIVCIIEDILAEIEDLYLEYHTRYKVAYRKNHDIIEDIKARNKYPYTIANLVDYFYVSKNEEKIYKEDTEKLKTLYNKLVGLLLSDDSLLEKFFKDENDISKILDKDTKKVAASYIQQINIIKSDFFEDKNDSKRKENLNNAMITKRYFKTTAKNQKFVYMTKAVTGQSKHVGYGYKKFEFNSSNQAFTKIKNDARQVLAYLMFSLYFSEEFEDELKKLDNYSKIDSLRDKFLLQLKSIAPLPNISDDSIQDVQKAVKVNSSVYWDTIGALEEYKDNYLKEYENLDHTKKIKSFEQYGDSVKFKTKYLYYDKTLKYYKKEKEFETPKEILTKIVSKLNDSKLIEVLNIYKNIKDTNSFNYVVSAMNIAYMLSTPRIYLDEETDKTSFFSSSLTHIYDFVVDLTNKRINLSDEEKNTLNKEYQIANNYSDMQVKLLLNSVFFPENKNPKGLEFLKLFAKKDENQKLLKENEDKYKSVTGLPQNLKSKERELYETIKNIEGITSGLEKILVEMKNVAPERRTLSKTVYFRVGSKLKVFSNILVYASAADYLFFNDEKKTIKSHIGFINDMANISVMVGGFIEKNPKMPLEVLRNYLSAKAVKEISLSSQKLLTYAENTMLKKLSIISIVVTTLFDSVNLYKREDYDALAVTTLATGLNIALLICTPTLPAFITGVLLTIITGIILNEIIDSDVDIYLKKSLLYKTIDFSVFKALFDKEQSKKYQAYYLFETTNKDDELKAISDDGFNDYKKLIDFIGKNYKGKENFFDTALNNELSFLKASIYGYKLELLDRRKGKKLKNIYGNDVQLWQNTFVKVPQILIDNKETKFIFKIDDTYKEIKQNLFIKESNYALYDLFNQDFNILKELELINYKKASIIVLSPLVELKYNFTYNYRELVYLDVLGFEQVSFTPEDKNNLEQFIEKKEDK